MFIFMRGIGLVFFQTIFNWFCCQHQQSSFIKMNWDFFFVYLKTLCRLAVNFFIFGKKISNEPLQTGDSFLGRLNYKFSLLNSLLTFSCWIGYSSLYFSRSWSISSNLSNYVCRIGLQYCLHFDVFDIGHLCLVFFQFCLEDCKLYWSFTEPIFCYWFLFIIFLLAFAFF